MSRGFLLVDGGPPDTADRYALKEPVERSLCGTWFTLKDRQTIHAEAGGRGQRSCREVLLCVDPHPSAPVLLRGVGIEGVELSRERKRRWEVFYSLSLFFLIELSDIKLLFLKLSVFCPDCYW